MEADVGLDQPSNSPARAPSAIDQTSFASSAVVGVVHLLERLGEAEALQG